MFRTNQIPKTVRPFCKQIKVECSHLQTLFTNKDFQSFGDLCMHKYALYIHVSQSDKLYPILAC